MNKTAIALTAAAGVFATTASADHRTTERALDESPHFTIACSDENGNADDYSLTIYPETGLSERYGGHFAAEFNFTTSQAISPYASPITLELDSQINSERFIFPLIAISSDEDAKYRNSRTILIDNSAHTAQFDLFVEADSYDNPNNKVTCNIPDMGF